MKAARSMLFSLLSIPLILAAPSAESAASTNEEFNFQELLAVLPAESLHAALHKHVDDKFRDGVYEHDRIAVQKVHNEDPGTATKVLAEAALHLLKRQSGNDTIPVVPDTTPTQTATETPTTATTPLSTPTTATTPLSTPRTATTASTRDDPPPVISTPATTAVVIPVQVSTTDSAGQATTLTTSAVVAPTISVEQSVTTTNGAGSTVVSTATVAAAIVTENGQVTTSPVAAFTPSTANPTVPTDLTTTNSIGRTVVLPSVTPGAVRTVSDDRGGVFVTTYTPQGGVISSLVLSTTTGADGRPSTITSFAIVAANTEAVPSSTVTPRLQSGATSVRVFDKSFILVAAIMLCGMMGATVLLL